MRKIFSCVLITFILLVTLTLLFLINRSNDHKDELEKKLDDLNNIDRKITYFKYKYVDRYLDYKNKYPSLTDIDIVTRVNLNLDYPFYENIKQTPYLNKTYILVNKYIFLPHDYVPNGLEEIDNNYTDSAKKLVKEAKYSFEEMAKDAKKENLNIRVISAYRSYEYQKKLYDDYVKNDGKNKADTYSARPGFSEHQTGLVIDVDNFKLGYEQFESTKEFEWMQNNAYKYGFILRYPENKENITGYIYEPWHYRYVGKKIAKYIHKNKISFDEYYVRFIEK